MTQKQNQVASGAKQRWEAPKIERIGTFGAVMQGGSRPNPDPGSSMRKVANMGGG